MAKYADLVTMVTDWANRDSTVLPDSVVQASLRYAADEAYKYLEIPPLEFTNYFVTRKDTALTFCTKTSEGVYATATSNNIKNAIFDENKINPDLHNISFAVPHDTISFIYLRSSGKINRPEIGDTVGGTTVTADNQKQYAIITSSDTPSVTSHRAYADTVINETTNSRVFYDFNDNTRFINYFTRKGTNILVAGDFEEGDVFELFYYRRLPALDARATVPSTVTLATAQADSDTYEVKTASEYDALTVLEKRTYQELEGSYVRYVAELANWLKDHNERVLLFGALYRCFDYLQEDQQAEKYRARFNDAIAELNQEEKKRKLSAGQTTIAFDAMGLI